MKMAASLVETEVRELVRRRGLDSAAQLSSIVDEVLAGYEAQLPTSDLPPLGDKDELRKLVVDNISGYGPLQHLMEDPEVEEIWINGPGKVFCARGGKHQLTNLVIADSEIARLVEQMLRSSGRRLDLSCPFVDATLPDGSRLHVVIPDVTRAHWAVNIRKFVLGAYRLDELVRLGSLDPAPAEFLAQAVACGCNIVVSGGTQTGKTTMLNCLSAAIPPTQRVITCEEVFELQIPLPDVVAMQTRQANLEGNGALGLRRLVSESLRMRPDRIIVGEVRGREALDLLVALNSGLPGMTSIHANNAKEAVTKLSTLPLLAGENVTQGFVAPTIAGCIDLVVHLTSRGGVRRTSEIAALTGRTEGGSVEILPLFARERDELRWTGHHLPRTEKFEAHGTEVKELLR
jgi:pilus assembly protein CpaF